MPTRRKKGHGRPIVQRVGRKTGLPPGVPVYGGEEGETALSPRVTVIDYDEGDVVERDGPDVDWLRACAGTERVTWVDVDGMHDADLAAQVGDAFGLHPLWIEDVLNPHARPKIELLDDRLLVIVRVLSSVDGDLEEEQVALVLGPTWVLSIQERPGDAWDTVRERIRHARGRIRRMGADYLLHALLDAVVDRYFSVLQDLDPRLDVLEDEAFSTADATLPRRAAVLRADVSQLRAAAWPLREGVASLLRMETPLIRSGTGPFYHDLGDHLAEIAEGIDTARERLVGVVELHLSMTSHQLNETMRVLTVVSTVFIPLSFLVGLYGMNFDHMPELHYRYGYPAVLALMVAMSGAMLVWFRRRGWW